MPARKPESATEQGFAPARKPNNDQNKDSLRRDELKKKKTAFRADAKLRK
jgi:hypothetical protein